MTTVKVELPPKLIPVFTGQARYRGAYGGRGSAKTRSFAKMSAVRGYIWSQAGEEGIILCGREFMNSLDESSLEEVKAAIRSEPWLAQHYDIGEKYVRTRDGRIEYKFTGLRHNLDSIKSKARIKLLWVDEAEQVSDAAWSKAIPTVREDDSEIWLTWNPERKNSATHMRFRENPPTDSKIVELNYRDNPYFPKVLELERLEDLQKRPESYAHVWEGDFVTVVQGAYFAKHLAEAKEQGRIGKVNADQLMTIRAYWDIGGTGAKADACAIWIVQFVGQEVRVLNYYEAVGQPLAAHVNWLRESGYAKALCVLPHDGAMHDKVYQVTYESSLRDAGFNVEVIPNMGAGAAYMRIEALRRLFPQIWFNADTTEGGRDALGWYHEKRDEMRQIGLGPAHDWSSHCFTGDTEIITRAGTCRLDSIPNVGEVLTPWGWKTYRNPRVTRRNAPLVEVVFKGGLTVKCTPDHLFMTENGWKSAESLTSNSLVLSSLTRSLGTSTADSTGCGLAKSISRGAARSFIAMCGRGLSVISRMAAIFTTGTAMRPTICYQTQSAWMQESIFPSHGMSTGGICQTTLATKRGWQLPSGTKAMKAGYGTSDTPSEASHGRSGNESRASVWNAVRNSMRSFALMDVAKSIAAGNVKRLRITSVRQLAETDDVWCLTVPDAECFSLSNGAVVHNCADAFGLMAVHKAQVGTAGPATKLTYKSLATV